MEKELQFRPIERATKIYYLCVSIRIFEPFEDCACPRVFKGFALFTGFCTTYSALPNNRDRIKNKFFSGGVVNPGSPRLTNLVIECRKVMKLAFLLGEDRHRTKERGYQSVCRKIPPNLNAYFA